MLYNIIVPSFFFLVLGSETLNWDLDLGLAFDLDLCLTIQVGPPSLCKLHLSKMGQIKFHCSAAGII